MKLFQQCDVVVECDFRLGAAASPQLVRGGERTARTEAVKLRSWIVGLYASQREIRTFRG